MKVLHIDRRTISCEGPIVSDIRLYDGIEDLMYQRPIFTCHGLENGAKLIPSSTYLCVINRSPKFKMLLPLLLDVKGRTGIRIHAGNKYTDSAGCILVGKCPVFGSTLSESRSTLDNLMSKLGSKDFIVFVSDPLPF